MKKISVGFIGLGKMGLPMVLSLLRAQFEVHVYDSHAIENLQIAKEAGAIPEQSCRQLALTTSFIISMLPSGEILSDILLGSENLAAHIRPETILLDMGSSNPIDTQRTAKKLAKFNINMIDAPVIGGVSFAKDASLDILVGGDAGLIEKCQPIFAAMGRSYTHCGPVGSGHALKSLTNFINTAAMMNAVEAMNIGKTFGIDEQVMSRSLIETCTGRNHPIIKKVIPQILTETYNSGMAIGLVEKDLNIALNIAKHHDCQHPLLEQASKIVSLMIKKLGPQVDQTTVAKFWK